MKAMKFFSIFSAFIFLLLASSVHATTITECSSLIQTLSTQLEGVEISGNNPDRTRASLESKLSGALTKLDQAKFCDAILKLSEFRDKVLQLAVPNRKGETKISPSDAESLAAGADDAIVCIRVLDPNCF